MKVIIHSIIWSIDTEIQRSGNPSNALIGFSLLERFGLLANVVREAYDLGISRWRSESLEDRTQLMYLLFTAPEYLFAYSDRLHLIGEDDKQELVRRLQVLSNNNPMMVIVPGTVAWKKPMLRSGAKRFHGGDLRRPKAVSRLEKFQHRMRVDEEALLRMAPDLIQRTINNAPNLHMKTYYFERREEDLLGRQDDIRREAQRASAQVTKNFMTSPERSFLARNTAYAFHAGREVGKYHKRGNYFEVLPNESDEGFVVFMPGGTGPGKGDRFQLGDLRFGIEICADHEAGYLSSGGGLAPHVQIILSAKAQFDPTHAVVNDGGYIVHACSDDTLCAAYGKGLGRGSTIDEMDVETRNSAYLGRLHYHRLVVDTNS